jgi:hypothetical protein
MTLRTEPVIITDCDTLIDFRSKVEEAKELQKLRQRPHGISAVALAVGKRITLEEETGLVYFIKYTYLFYC